jgi:lipid A 3-O-deacylase
MMMLRRNSLIESRRWRGHGGSRVLHLTVWILFGGIIFNPFAAWGDAPRPPEDARDFLKSGTVELGIAAGIWQAVDIGNHPPSTDRRAVFVLPKIGMIVTDEFRAGLLSGNIELGVEPLFARFTKPFAAEAAGGTGVLTYNFLSFGRWVPFWEVGAGVLWTNLAPRIPEQSTPVNFVVQTGPGVHYFLTHSLTVTAGVRFHHFSNADTGERNVGLNGVLPYLGFSWFLAR